MVKTLRDMLIKHQHLLLCQHVSSNFLTFSKSNVEYYNLSEICNNILKKNTFKESRHLSKNYPLENDKIESMKASFEIKIESHF